MPPGSSATASGSALHQSVPLPPEISDLHCFTETNGVITSTMNDIPGYRVVSVLGAIYGITVRSRNWAAGLGMVIKSVAGGELRAFTHLIYNSRNDAVSRLVAECQSRGGNAVIALRFNDGNFDGFAQVCAYGTACVVEKIDHSLPEYPQLVVHQTQSQQPQQPQQPQPGQHHQEQRGKA